MEKNKNQIGEFKHMKNLLQNFWEKYQLTYENLLKSFKDIKYGQQIEKLIDKILIVSENKDERYWLMMFLLTDSDIICIYAKRIYNKIMSSKVLKKDDKLEICCTIIDYEIPFHPSEIIGDKKYRKLVDEFKDELIGRLENSGGTDREFLIELVEDAEEEELFELVKSLDVFKYAKYDDLNKLPQVSRRFPIYLTRYALYWFCNLNFDNHKNIIEDLLIDIELLEAEEKKQIFNAVLDFAENFHETMDEGILAYILDEGRDFSQAEIRKRTYKLGSKIVGKGFLKSGFTDYSKSVRKYVKKIFDSIPDEDYIKRKLDRESPELKKLRIKLENIFSEINIEMQFGRVLAVILAAQSLPYIIKFEEIFKMIMKKGLIFNSVEQAREFSQVYMDLWNLVADVKTPKEFDFLYFKPQEILKDYVTNRIDELNVYLEVIYKYADEKLSTFDDFCVSEIKTIKRTSEFLKIALRDDYPEQYIDIKYIEERIRSEWNRMFFINEWQRIQRSKAIKEEFSGRRLEPVKKISRNDPCPCGSGKKYKHCCMN